MAYRDPKVNFSPDPEYNLFCKKCGERLKKTDKFCKNCGTSIVENLKLDLSNIRMQKDPKMAELLGKEFVLFHQTTPIKYYTEEGFGNLYYNTYTSEVIISETKVLFFDEFGALRVFPLEDVAIISGGFHVRRGKKRKDYYFFHLAYQRDDWYDFESEILAQVILAKSLKLGYLKKQVASGRESRRLIPKLEKEIEKIKIDLERVNRFKEKYEAKKQRKLEKREQKKKKKAKKKKKKAYN